MSAMPPIAIIQGNESELTLWANSGLMHWQQNRDPHSMISSAVFWLNNEAKGAIGWVCALHPSATRIGLEWRQSTIRPRPRRLVAYWQLNMED
jgi:hypothetical protein